MSKIRVTTTASNEVANNPEGSHLFNTVVYSGPVSGKVTAGVLTINVKSPGGTVFEVPKDSSGSPLNTIDLAAPETLNIQGRIVEYEFTMSGFSGTATEINMEVSSYE